MPFGREVGKFFGRKSKGKLFGISEGGKIAGMIAGALCPATTPYIVALGGLFGSAADAVAQQDAARRGRNSAQQQLEEVERTAREAINETAQHENAEITQARNQINIAESELAQSHQSTLTAHQEAINRTRQQQEWVNSAIEACRERRIDLLPNILSRLDRESFQLFIMQHPLNICHLADRVRVAEIIDQESIRHESAQSLRPR